MSLLSSIEKWFSRPFDSQGSALQWFLFFGLILLIAWAWAVIIRGYRAL